MAEFLVLSLVTGSLIYLMRKGYQSFRKQDGSFPLCSGVCEECPLKTSRGGLNEKP